MSKTPKEPKTKRGEGVDPDDAPELTEEWFRNADIYHGEFLISWGERSPDNKLPKN